MATLQISTIHEAHVAAAARTWSSGPSSDDRERSTFLPQLMAVCRDRSKRTVERVMVSPTVDERDQAAAELGRTIARDGLKPFAVTAVAESWMAPDDGSERPPSARPDRREVLTVATGQADGRTLTTVLAIERSVGGEAALGGVLLAAEPGFEAVLVAEAFEAYRASTRPLR